MTELLTALAVLVGAVAGLNLLLTVGAIRRLRQHTQQLANLSNLAGTPPPIMIGKGERATEFAATTTDGEPVSRDLLTGHTLIGVLSPDCSACQERLPEFISHAEAFPGGRGQVLAMLAGEPQQVEEYREQLAPVARVVIEPPVGGSISAALQVQGWPAFGVVDAEGTVVATELELDSLPVGVPAGTHT